MTVFNISNEYELEIDLFRGNSRKPYYSILIGKNGSYKSEILSSIAYPYARKRKQEHFISNTLSSETNFNKVIAVSLSPFCKFPTPSKKKFSTQVKEAITKNNYDIEQKNKYEYIGIKSNSSFMAFGKNNFYEILLRSLIAGRNKDRLLLIQKTFEVLSLKHEVIFHLSLKLPLAQILDSLKGKKFSKTDQSLVNNLLRRNSFDFINDSSTSSNTSIHFNFKDYDKFGSAYIDQLLAIDILKQSGLISFKKVTISNTDNTRIFDLSNLSSGESSFLYTFLGIISLIEDNTLLLIDEPELSLHPNLQINFLQYLDEIINSFADIKILLATHSPHLISSLPLERSTVFALTRSGSSLTVRDIVNELNGWSVEDILFEVFQIKTARNLPLNETVLDLAEMMAGVSEFKKDEFEKKLSLLKNLSLPNNDPLRLLIKDAHLFALKNS